MRHGRFILATLLVTMGAVAVGLSQGQRDQAQTAKPLSVTDSFAAALGKQAGALKHAAAGPTPQTVIAEVNCPGAGAIDLAVAIPGNTSVIGVEYWVKEGPDNAPAGWSQCTNPDRTCPGVAYFGFTPWFEYPQTDGKKEVQSRAVNWHSSMVRRSRLVVRYQ
jgi:hypothetical protein